MAFESHPARRENPAERTVPRKVFEVGEGVVVVAEEEEVVVMVEEVVTASVIEQVS